MAFSCARRPLGALTRVLAIAFCVLASGVSRNTSPRYLQTYTETDEYVGAMLQRVNDERAAQGLAALCKNSKLQSSAQRHSDDQAANNFMNHTGSDGSSMSERITDAGYDWRGVAENVAAGQVDVAEVMDAWMNSEGHRHNILGNYTMIGAAYTYNADSRYHHYWTQDFGQGDSEVCDDGSSPTQQDGTDAQVASSTATDPESPWTEAPWTESPSTGTPVMQAPDNSVTSTIRPRSDSDKPNFSIALLLLVVMAESCVFLF